MSSEPLNYSPTPKPKPAYCLFFGLLISTVVVLALSRSVTAYRWIPQLVGVIFAVAAIVVYTKYLSGRFCFSTVNGTLWITKTEGRRQSTYLGIPLLSVSDVAVLDRAKRKSDRPARGVKRYRYFASLSPDSVVKITFRLGNDPCEALLEGSAPFADALLAAVGEAKLMHAEEE